MNIKKDDKVVVLSGKDKGKEGKVLSADPKGGKLIVEGVNVATKHQKPKNQQDQGGEDDLLTKLGDLCLQGHGRLPEVRQADPHCAQDHGRQKGPHLQKVRRRTVKEGATNYGKYAFYEEEVCGGSRSRSDDEVPVRERYADPEDREDRRQRRLRRLQG